MTSYRIEVTYGKADEALPNVHEHLTQEQVEGGAIAFLRDLIDLGGHGVRSFTVEAEMPGREPLAGQAWVSAQPPDPVEHGDEGGHGGVEQQRRGHDPDDPTSYQEMLAEERFYGRGDEDPDGRMADHEAARYEDQIKGNWP
jgi:hypothetical protein